LKLSDLYIKLGLRKDGFDKGLDDAKKKTNVFGNAVKKIGGLLAGAFAVDRLIAFGRELVEIGGVAQGVEDAFARIGDAQTLRGLQQATRGTVSELELMKRAVSANNLGLPIQNLASLFEFATKRAQDTGESVDYLVNSIVTGIGRKSPLILDNLGISAIQLREKLNGVGMESASVAVVAAAVGEIAAESMRQSGEIIETNAVKMQQLKTAWDDWKLSISQSDTVLNFVSESLKEVMALGTIFTSPNVSGWQKIRALLFDSREEFMAMADQIEKTKRIAEEMGPNEAEWLSGESFDVPKWEENIRTIADVKKETDELKKSIDNYGVGQKEEIQNTLRQIDANEKLIESLTILKRTKDAAVPDTMDSRGTSQDELISLVPDFSVDTSTLANMESFFSRISETLQKQKDDLLEETNDLRAELSDGFDKMIEGSIGALAADFGTALASGDWSNFGGAVLEVIGGFMQQLGALMIAYAINMGLFAESAKNPLSWPIALAAGIAMVAAGAAISSFASKGLTGGSGAYSGATASTGGSSASTALSGDVRFVLEGDKLVGAINGSRQRRSITG